MRLYQHSIVYAKRIRLSLVLIYSFKDVKQHKKFKELSLASPAFI